MNAAWLYDGRGATPSLHWSFSTDAPLVDLRLARESGEVLAADQSGGVYLLDRNGRVLALTRLHHPQRLIAWSDTGTGGVICLDDNTIAWIDRQLQVVWKKELPEEVVGLAMSPHATHMVACLSSGLNVIYDADKTKVATFESLRPLRFVQFLATAPALVAAADYGFFCRYRLDGTLDWSERLWSTAADLAITSDGSAVTLAGLAHGVQAFNGDGESEGSFVLDGTVHLVAMTYRPQRIAAATMERHLVLLAQEGTLVWLVPAPEDILRLQLDPLGQGVTVGFSSGRVIRLACAG